MCNGVAGAGTAATAGAADVSRLIASADTTNTTAAADVSTPQDQTSIILANFSKMLAQSGFKLT